MAPCGVQCARRSGLLAGALGLAGAVMLAAPAARADDDDVVVLPVLRPALGPAIHLDPTAPQFALDLDVGAVVLVGPEHLVAIDPELGYSFDGFGSHAFNLEVGFGVGVPLCYALIQPRLLVGTLAPASVPDAERRGTVGMRNGLGIHMLYDAFSMEIAHQFLSYGGVLEHDLHVMFGTNPAAMAFVFAQMVESLR